MSKLTIRKNNNLSIKNYIMIILLIIINVQANAAYKQDPKYGNGQNAGFINAMYGTSQDFTPEEIKTFNHVNYLSNNNKCFLRIGVNSGSNRLNNLKNVSVPITLASGILNNKKQKINNQKNLEIGIGYKGNRFSTEMELFFSKKLKYDQLGLFSNQSGDLSSVITSNAMLLNGYYDFFSSKLFDMFIGAGLGLGINTTKSKFNNIVGVNSNINYSKRNFTGAYNLLIGCKFKVISQFFIKTSLRYTGLSGFGNFKYISTSKLEWQDSKDNLVIQGNRSFIGFSLSFVHVFIL